MCDSDIERWNNEKLFAEKTITDPKCSKFIVLGSLHKSGAKRTLRTMCAS